MKSNLFEGWKIQCDSNTAGYVKFNPKVDGIFKSHVTVDIKIPKQLRGRNIGRIALRKAMKASSYSTFVAHLRKSNTPSKRMLAAVGFQVFNHPKSSQLCMVIIVDPSTRSRGVGG